MEGTLALDPTALAALDKVQVKPEPPSAATNYNLTGFAEQIVDAYQNTREYAKQLNDPETRQKLERRLGASGVHGAVVFGIGGHDDVERLLGLVTDWKEVDANLQDEKIRVLQGTLPPGVNALTAYASVREIAEYGGDPAVDTIKPKIGRQKADDYYQCTLMSMPTNVFTVQLRLDEDKCEMFHQWFPGVELSSRIIRNYGDSVVRCGVKIQPANKQGQRHAQGRRTTGTR